MTMTRFGNCVALALVVAGGALTIGTAAEAAAATSPMVLRSVIDSRSLVDSVRVEVFYYIGRRYYWYEDGWRGEGWYRCGYQRRDGGRDIAVTPEIIERVHPSNNPGAFFIAVLVGLVVFTNTRLRGIYSVVTVVAAAFFVVLFAWLGWWDDILRVIPLLSARANMGCYRVFSTTLLLGLAAVFLGLRSSDDLACSPRADDRRKNDWRTEPQI
jgi:hypothetical protein